MAEKMIIRKAYDRFMGSTIDCGPGKTEQAHKKECDMNYILREYTRTGLLKHAKENQGRYDDVTGIDFQSAMDVVVNAQRMFEELPSALRKRFGNNPASFLDFVQDTGNAEEMKKLGILKGNDGIDIRGVPVDVPTEPVKPAEPAEPPAAE